MARRDRRKKRGRPAKSVTERMIPTPETAAKLTPDPLRQMMDAGLVDTAGERAAYEIRAVYLAVCRSVMSKRQRLGPMFGVSARGVPPEIPESLAVARAKRYLPWVQSEGPDVVDATLRVVVDSEPVPEFLRLKVALALARYSRAFERAA